MKYEPKTNNLLVRRDPPERIGTIQKISSHHQQKSSETTFQLNSFPYLDELLSRLTLSQGKMSFLVFRHNKYFNVPTESIAFFYVKHDSTLIVCFDRHEYCVNYSLEQIQNLVGEKKFFRLNRQYLINFHAVKEVEHFFARKLLVNSVIPSKDQLLVPKERVSLFLHWLDNR